VRTHARWQVALARSELGRLLPRGAPSILLCQTRPKTHGIADQFDRVTAKTAFAPERRHAWKPGSSHPYRRFLAPRSTWRVKELKVTRCQ